MTNEPTLADLPLLAREIIEHSQDMNKDGLEWRLRKLLAANEPPITDDAKPTFAQIVDLAGELGRAAYYLLDSCETSGPVGEEIHTIEQSDIDHLSGILDRIEALPFEEPGYILGPGGMLQAALKQTAPTPQADPVREAAQNLMPYLKWTIGPESPGHHPTMPSAVDALARALAQKEPKV